MEPTLSLLKPALESALESALSTYVTGVVSTGNALSAATPRCVNNLAQATANTASHLLNPLAKYTLLKGVQAKNSITGNT